MTIGSSLALIAVGAILKWAVTEQVSGFSIQTLGLVLFIVGLIGLALSIFYLMWWADRGVGPDDPRYRRPPGPPSF
jgi:hypothetical protein